MSKSPGLLNTASTAVLQPATSTKALGLLSQLEPRKRIKNQEEKHPSSSMDPRPATTKKRRIKFKPKLPPPRPNRRLQQERKRTKTQPPSSSATPPPPATMEMGRKKSLQQQPPPLHTPSAATKKRKKGTAPHPSIHAASSKGREGEIEPLPPSTHCRQQLQGRKRKAIFLP